MSGSASRGSWVWVDSAMLETHLAIRVCPAWSLSSCKNTQLSDARRTLWCRANRTTCSARMSLRPLCQNAAEPAPRRACSADSASNTICSQPWAPGAGCSWAAIVLNLLASSARLPFEQLRLSAVKTRAGSHTGGGGCLAGLVSCTADWLAGHQREYGRRALIRARGWRGGCQGRDPHRDQAHWPVSLWPW